MILIMGSSHIDGSKVFEGPIDRGETKDKRFAIFVFDVEISYLLL